MSVKKFLQVFFLCIFLMAFGGTAADALLIDDFATPAGGQGVTIFNGSPGGLASVTAISTTALGGWREIAIQIESVQTGSTSITAEVFASDSPSNYQLAQSIRMNGFGSITYDANGAGLNVDFSNFAGIRLGAVDNDKQTVYSLSLETFSGGSSSASQTLPEDSLGIDIDFLFSSLVGTADLADIDRILFTINPEKAGDVYIENIVTIVPAPATLLLVGSGLLGLVAARRKNANN